MTITIFDQATVCTDASLNDISRRKSTAVRFLNGWGAIVVPNEDGSFNTLELSPAHPNGNTKRTYRWEADELLGELARIKGRLLYRGRPQLSSRAPAKEDVMYTPEKKMPLAVFNEKLKNRIRFPSNNARSIILDGGTTAVTWSSPNNPNIRVEGELKNQTTRLKSCLVELIQAVDMFRCGQIALKDLIRLIGPVIKMRPRSQTYGYTTKFYFRPLVATGVRTVDEDGDTKDVSVQTVEIGDESYEQSRYRPITKFDRDKIVAIRLDDLFDWHPDAVRPILVETCRQLREDGQDWTIVGNHEKYYIFAVSDYMMSTVMPEILEEQVWNQLWSEIEKQEAVQKAPLMGKFVTVSLLAAGDCTHDSDVVIDLSDYIVHEDSPIDGTVGVLRVLDGVRRARAKQMPMCLADQARWIDWMWKGIVSVENPWLEAGIYPEGLSIRNQDKSPMIPTRMSIKNEVTLDSASLSSGRPTVTIPMQLVTYCRNEEFVEWYIERACSTIKGLVSGEVTTSSRVHDVFTSMERDDVISDSGRNRGFEHSIRHRVVSKAMVGNTWALRKGQVIQVDGSSLRGIIRGLTVPGANTLVQVSPHLKDKEIVLTEDVAERLGVKMGDYLHGFRNPILPHRGVATRFKVKDVLTKEGYWFRFLNQDQRDEILAEFPDFDWQNPEHFQLGLVCWISQNCIECMDGDVDGDRIVLTRVIVEDFETGDRIFDPPLINPSTHPKMAVEKLTDDHVWFNRKDRFDMGAASQTRISDWLARQFHDIAMGWHDPRGVKNPIFHKLGTMTVEEMDAAVDEEFSPAFVRIVRALIQAKKHIVNLSDQKKFSIRSKDGCPVNLYRQFESILSAFGGLYRMVQSENGHLKKEQVFVMDEDEETTIFPLDILKEMESREYPFARILRAMVDAYDELWSRYEQDDLAKYHQEDRTLNLDGSRISWYSKYNTELRAARVKYLERSYIPKVVDGKPVYDQPGIPMDLRSFITGKLTATGKDGKRYYKNQLSGVEQRFSEVPILPLIARAVMGARKATVSVRDGEPIQRFLRREGDNYVVSIWPNGPGDVVDRNDITILVPMNDNNVMRRLGARVRHWIDKQARDLVEKYHVRIPDGIVCKDEVEYVREVIEMRLVADFTSTDAISIERIPANSEIRGSVTSYWSFLTDLVSAEALINCMAPEGESVYDVTE